MLALTVNINNGVVVRDHSFKPFDAQDYTLIKYLVDSNSLWALTASKKRDHLGVFEIKANNDILKHKIPVNHSTLTRYLAKGFLEEYSVQRSHMRLLVHYESIHEKKVEYLFANIDLARNVIKTMSFPLDMLENNPIQLRRSCYLSGMLTDSSILLAAINYKNSTFNLAQFNMSDGKLIATLRANILEEASHAELINYTSLKTKPISSMEIKPFISKPFAFNVVHLKKDSVAIEVHHISVINAKYLPPRTYMGYEIVRENGKFQFQSLTQNSTSPAHNSFFRYAAERVNKSKYAELTKVDYSNLALFQGSSQKIFLSTIDKKTNELVIEWLNFDGTIDLQTFNILKNIFITSKPIIVTNPINAGIIYLKMQDKYSDYKLKPFFID